MNAAEEYVNRDEILPLLGSVKRSGEWLMAFCPAHQDGTKHGGKGGQSLGLSDTGVLRCFAGCAFKDVMAALRGSSSTPTPRAIRASSSEHLVKVYQYVDEDGVVVAEKGRFETADSRKTFRWRKPDTDAWSGGIVLSEMPLYGLHLLQQSKGEPVYFVEGEKACEACWDQGLIAVTHAGGAGIKEFGPSLEALRGREVYLWPDNDAPGRAYMTLLQARLSPIAKAIAIISVPVPEKGDAYDYFAMGGRVGDIASSSPTSPTVQVLAEDSVEITIPTIAGPAKLVFSNMEKHSRDFDAEVEITPFLRDPYVERINLLSASARTNLRRDLDDVYGKDAGWTEVLNKAFSLARETYLRQDRSTDVAVIPEPMGETFLVEPLVVNDGPTIFFGDGSSFKSYFLFQLALCMGLGIPFCDYTTRTRPVMVIDYEDSGSNFRRRMTRLSKGLHQGLTEPPPYSVYYWPANGTPLKDQAEAIKRTCDKLGIGLLIIDSAAPACGGDPSEAEDALSYFRALKRIGLPSITIAHINKGGDPNKPFGSVFWHNEARRTWFVSRVQEEDSDELDIGLFCRKVNDGRRPSPLAFHVSFDGLEGPVSISQGDMSTVPELNEQTSYRNRIWVCLENRTLTTAEIASETGIDGKVVDSELRRGPFAVAGQRAAAGGGRPANLWGRKAQ